MNNGQSGTPQPNNGTSPHQDGSPTLSELKWRCTQVNAMLREISNLGQSIPNDTKYVDTGGHDAGDEDPNAWS